MKVASLAFPYYQDVKYVRLNEVVLANDDGWKYHFRLDETKCFAIVKANGTEQGLLDYTDNKNDEDHPLLVRIPSDYHQMQLNLAIKVDHLRAKSLVIAKTRLQLNELEPLLVGGNIPNGVEISRIDGSHLPVDESVVDYQKSIINDVINGVDLQSGPVNVFLFEVENDHYKHLLNFKYWLDVNKENNKPFNVATSPPSYPYPTIQDYKETFNFVLKDGPEFRNNVNDYEKNIPLIQRNVTSLIEELRSLESNKKRLSYNRNKILELINNISSLNPIILKLKFKKDFKVKFYKLFEPLETNVYFFLRDVCDAKLLDKIKTITNIDDETNELNTLKKAFENDSKDYYNWLKKYLSNEKQRPELKLLMKRKKFELSKFDYLNYLNNFSNNQYLNTLCENLFKFIEVEFPIDLNKDGIKLRENYQVYLNILTKYNSEKFKLRQMIETCQSNEELTQLVQQNNLNIDVNELDNSPVTENNLDLLFSPLDIQDSQHQHQEISGILYSLGGQGKPGWHKEWVVIKNGELIQYTDWRTGSSPIDKPIQLALSNVKPIVHDKRQHCFEIFTSGGQKHTFQAINQNDRDKWVKTIYNARQVVNTDKLNQKQLNSDNKPNKDSRLAGLKKLQLKFDKPVVVGENANSPVQMKSDVTINKDYLKAVRTIANSDNHICADCGSIESVEWISMTFLVVLCINCSSCHRHLGSHVSKIKSLQYDNFDEEIEILLNYVNNRIHNSYLENDLKGIEKHNLISFEEKLNFTTNKYIKRWYKIGLENVNDLLVKAVQRISIPDTIKYILLGGEVNVEIKLGNNDSLKIVTLFEYSLRKYLIVGTKPEIYFVISEFLLLNGCKLPLTTQLDLTPEAMTYLKNKFDKTM